MADDNEDMPKIMRKSPNDIRDLTSIKQLEDPSQGGGTSKSLKTVKLDLESPRLLKACEQLGIPVESIRRPNFKDFEDKSVSQDIVDLRFKHAQEKLVERINKVLRQRRQIIRLKHNEAYVR